MATSSSTIDALNDFDIFKYDICKEWDAHEWLLALSDRSQIRYFLRTQKKMMAKWSLPNEMFIRWGNNFLDVAEQRLQNPVNLTPNIPQPVAPAVLLDLLLVDLINIAKITKEIDMHEYRTMRLFDLTATTDFQQSLAYLSINLDAPDNIIQEKFNNWLKKIRLESGITPKYSELSFNEKDFGRWTYQKLLPYLDLVFWAKLSGNVLTQSVLGEKLFPHVEDTKDRMKSLAKNALRLVSAEYTEALARQCQTY